LHLPEEVSTPDNISLTFNQSGCFIDSDFWDHPILRGRGIGPQKSLCLLQTSPANHSLFFKAFLTAPMLMIYTKAKPSICF
jgi:hypothetical protein